MENQAQLFQFAPTRLFVAARWTRGGWVVNVQASIDTPEGASTKTASYELLTALELLDVVGAELAGALRL